MFPGSVNSFWFVKRRDTKLTNNHSPPTPGISDTAYRDPTSICERIIQTCITLSSVGLLKNRQTRDAAARATCGPSARSHGKSARAGKIVLIRIGQRRPRACRVLFRVWRLVAVLLVSPCPEPPIPYPGTLYGVTIRGDQGWWRPILTCLPAVGQLQVAGLNDQDSPTSSE